MCYVHLSWWRVLVVYFYIISSNTKPLYFTHLLNWLISICSGLTMLRNYLACWTLLHALNPSCSTTPFVVSSKDITRFYNTFIHINRNNKEIMHEKTKPLNFSIPLYNFPLTSLVSFSIQNKPSIHETNCFLWHFNNLMRTIFPTRMKWYKTFDLLVKFVLFCPCFLVSTIYYKYNWFILSICALQLTTHIGTRYFTWKSCRTD